MAIITLPTKFAFSRVNKFGLTRKNNKLRSRYTAQGQKLLYPYAIWEFEADLIDYDGPQAAAIRSFLVKLEGSKNQFRLPVPGYTKPQSGYASNAAVLYAGASRAMSLTVNAPGANVAFLSEGDYITIQDELKMITEPVALNGAGQAIINFKPGLRAAAAVGVVVTLQNPWVLLEASEDDVASWGLTAPVRHGVKIDAIESITI